MTGERYDVAAALRALASPLLVGAVAVLALNDHVLKAVWPSFVTGKLSDVAGLVVAPVLLGVALALLRVRRAPLVSVLLTGSVFAWVKTTGLGAEVAGAAWTHLWGPSVVLRDPTDLLALPALAVAWVVQTRARRSESRLRPRAAAVVGALVLPFAVVATAATSCSDPSDVSTRVGVVEGRWDGSAVVERRLVWQGATTGTVVLTADGTARDLTPSEGFRLTDSGPRLSEQCDPASPDRCWRLVAGPRPQVDGTTDGGETWRTEYLMRSVTYDSLHEELDEDGGCGGGPRLQTDDIAVLATDRGPLVAVAAAEAGLLLRDPAGRWTLRGRPDRQPELADVVPSLLPEEQLTPVETVAPPEGTAEGTGDDVAPSGPAGSPQPAPATCPSPETRTVTPHPANGPPTARESCPS